MLRLLVLLLLLASPAYADMFPDNSNAVLPEARKNIGLNSINPYDYGAVCDGTSHPLSTKYATLAAAQADYPSALALTNEIDGVAINKALDQAKANTAAGKGVRLVAAQGDCLSDVSINVTRLTGQNTSIDFSGMRLVTTAAGKIALDMIGSDRIKLSNLSVISGGEDTAPAVGFQYGRGGQGQSAGSNTLTNVYVSGRYTKSSCINYGSESTTSTKLYCHNSQPVASFTGSISGNTLTASAVTNTIRVGMAIKSTNFPTGTGYTALNLLTVTGGTCTTQPVIRVDSVLKGGQISTWSVATPGSCTVPPPAPFVTTGGSGTGGQFTGVFTPASLTSITIRTPGHDYVAGSCAGVPPTAPTPSCLTVLTGECSVDPQIQIDGVDVDGGITAASIAVAGTCETLVANPLTILVSDGPSAAGAGSFTGTFTPISPSILTTANLYDGLVQNGTYVTALGTGTGGAGTYTVYPAQTVAGQPMATNSYSFIADAANHWGVTSEYTTIPWALDVSQSFLSNIFTAAEFRSATTSTPVWMMGTHHHRYYGGYFLSSGGDHVVDLYSTATNDNRSLYLDLHQEDNATPYGYYIAGPNTVPRLPDFKHKGDITFPTTALFKLAPGVLAAQMYNADIQVPHASAGFVLAATPARWWVSGDFFFSKQAVGYPPVMNVANWIGGRGYVENVTAGRSDTPLGDSAILYSRWTPLSYTGNTAETCLLSVPLPLLHINDTIEINVLGERTLGAGRPDTDEVDISIAMQGGGCVPGTNSITGTLIHKAVLNSASAVTTNILASIHNAGANNAQVYFANSAPGGIGVSAGPIGTSSLITTSNMTPQHVMIRCRNATNGTDTCTVRGVTIKLIPGKS